MAPWKPQGVDPGPSASWQLWSPWSQYRKEKLGGLVLSSCGAAGRLCFMAEGSGPKTETSAVPWCERHRIASTRATTRLLR